MGGFLLLGGLALTIGIAVGFVAVSTVRRYGSLVAIGVAVATAVLLASYLTAPTDPGNCSDCGEYFGRWWEPYLVVFILFSNVVGWATGLAIGVGLRDLFGRRVNEFRTK